MAPPGANCYWKLQTCPPDNPVRIRQPGARALADRRCRHIRPGCELQLLSNARMGGRCIHESRFGAPLASAEASTVPSRSGCCRSVCEQERVRETEDRP